MLEHARMEERVLFPVLERTAHRGVCKAANAEHARDLPMINGIKEDIKSLLVMEAGTPSYQEALVNLSLRLKTLLEHCKEHFKEEERELIPLFDAANRMLREEGNTSSRWAEEVMRAMEATHSQRLFPFFMAGLLPQEAVQYLDIVCRCIADKHHVVSMLRSLVASLEGKHPHSVISNYSLKSVSKQISF
ncbi:hypothetical protein ACMD2_18167 [Ananas comosus]|uniref:Hemerythrin-like domain-containing protein n=2 Tax=Ananas comosus TaxID=4615 RepID=A0A199VIQ1_ANACO|nr:hypothetical protein ACMD2_18167 [Ananas comosus]